MATFHTRDNPPMPSDDELRGLDTHDLALHRIINTERTKVDTLLAACKEVVEIIEVRMDFGERPCIFCGHHHLHDLACVYTRCQAAIASVRRE